MKKNCIVSSLTIIVLAIFLPLQCLASNIVHFSQNDSKWTNDQLGKSSSSDLVPNYSYTIGSDGCAITSVAMTLKSKGIDIDPQRLNWWLADHNGFKSDGLLLWNTIAGYSPAITKVNNYSYANWEAIDGELAKGGSVVIGLKGTRGPHFVVIVDKRDGQYYINDPWFNESNGKNIPLSNNIIGTTNIYRTVTFEIIPPPQPVNLSISGSTFNSVTLSWSKNFSPYFSSYKLYRGETSPVTESSQLIATIADENQLTYTDAGVLAKTNYYYKLFTCNTASQCTPSNEVSLKTEQDPEYIGKIIYTSQVGNLSQLFLMNGNPSNVTQLRASQYNDGDPKWSPDGERILFSTIINSNQRQVFMMKDDGTEVRQVTFTKYSAQQASWFPDGEHIVYMGMDEVVLPDGTKTNVKGLYVQNVNETARKIITPPTIYPYSPSVTPDGLRIVFHATWMYGNQKGGLFMVNTDGTGFTQLTQENDIDPEVSPDGKKLVFSSTRDTNNNWYRNLYLTIEEFTGIVFNLTGGGGGSNIEPSWSPDSQKIVYASRESIYDDYEINILDLDTTQRTKLTDNNVDEHSPDWWWEE